MPIVSGTRWAELVAAYEAARDASDAASEILDAMPVAQSDGSEEERRFDALREVFSEREDELLDVAAPTLEGVAYQLRVFGERHLSAVVDEPEMEGEDRPAGEHLRRILEGLDALIPPSRVAATG